MPRVDKIRGAAVSGHTSHDTTAPKRAGTSRGPKNNSAAGLDIATSAARPAPAASAPTGRFVFEKHDPVTGPHIVSKPGDEPPLPVELKITRVYDGDTLVGTDAKGVEYHVRVQNMNTTELKPHEEGADEGKAATEKLVFGKKVKLVYDKDRPKDGYNRILAQVLYKTDKGWEDLAHTVIRQGWAHLFIVSEVGNPANLKELLEDEAKARKDGLGLWKLPRFKGADFAVTSFHANGNGNEKEYPNAEYLRIANITGRPLELADYTLSTEQGKKFHLPKGTLKPGHTVQIFTGEGKNVVDSQAATKVFLGSTTPIWDNVKCTATITAKGGRVAAERIHEAKTPMRDIAKLPNPVSQMTLAGLGQDVEMKYIFPKRIDLTRAKGDDGDTTFILSPADGVIKVDIEDPRTGKTLRRDVHIGDQKESPAGYLAVRYFGVDTPETHLEVDQPDGTKIAYSQGKPGEIAAEEVEKILGKATAAHILPIGFDVYGRLLGMVIAKMPDGKEMNVNEYVAHQGLGEMAMYYKRGAWDPKMYATFQAATKHAWDNKLGIYGTGPGACPERPVEMRRRLRHVATKPPYVIDMETKVVYNGADIAKVTPWKRLFVFDNALSPAVKELGLKLGPGVSG